MMKHLLMFSAALLLAGCQSTLRPATDYDAGADFTSFKTFSWIDPNPLIRQQTQRPLSPLVQERLMTATREALTRRGFRYVEDADSADLAVAFTVGSREGIRITSYPTSSFHRRDHRWRGGYWGHPRSNVRTRQYTEGQLAIDIFSVADAIPVWHGSVSRRVTQGDRQEPDDALQEVVNAIIDQFPPQMSQ